MNVKRWLIGGVLAGILCFLGDGIVHGAILGSSWADAMQALGKGRDGNPGGIPFFIAYDIVKGLAIVWLYAAIRPRFGAGPKTAAIAGCAAWVLTSLLPVLTQFAFALFPQVHLVKWTALEAGPIFAAAFAGAFVYREE